MMQKRQQQTTSNSFRIPGLYKSNGRRYQIVRPLAARDCMVVVDAAFLSRHRRSNQQMPLQHKGRQIVGQRSNSPIWNHICCRGNLCARPYRPYAKHRWVAVYNTCMPTGAIRVTANRHTNPSDFGVGNNDFQSCDVHKQLLEPMKNAFGTARTKLVRQCCFGGRIEPAAGIGEDGLCSESDS